MLALRDSLPRPPQAKALTSHRHTIEGAGITLEAGEAVPAYGVLHVHRVTMPDGEVITTTPARSEPGHTHRLELRGGRTAYTATAQKRAPVAAGTKRTTSTLLGIPVDRMTALATIVRQAKEARELASLPSRTKAAGTGTAYSTILGQSIDRGARATAAVELDAMQLPSSRSRLGPMDMPRPRRW